MKTFISAIKYPLSVLFWLVLWHVASLVIDSAIILVSPIDTFVRLIQLAGEGSFWRSIGFSMIRIVSGFGLALAIGVLAASLASCSKIVYTLLLPAVNTIKAIPVASFAILALMWVGTANLSAFVALVTVFPIVYFNTYEGIKNTDTKLLEMSAVFEVSLPRIIRRVYLPSVLPYVISAAASGLGFAFKAGVAAELIGLVRNTIGINLQTARNFLQTADVLAWTITIVLLSYLMEKLFLLCLKRVKIWQSD